MASAPARPPSPALHPVHAMILAASLPLFAGALLSDWAYWSSGEVQWINFAAWLIVAGLPLAGVAFVWSLAGLVRGRRGEGLLALMLGATLGLGTIDAMIHARDGWATMPDGLVASALLSLLALASVWLGFARFRTDAR